jgi:predicted RNase H-like nuclease (RuvC/YqgF family)
LSIEKSIRNVSKKGKKEEKEKEEREQREKKLIEDKEKDEKEKEIFKIEISEHKAKIDYLNRQFNNERDQYEKKLGQLRDELRDEKEKRETLDKQLVQYKQQCETKNYENMAMKTQVKKLNDDLNKLRGDFHNKQLTPRLFQVERIKMVGIVKQKKTMVIIFDWNKKKNVCEMKFQRSQTGGKVKEDIVNILDITFKEDKNKEIIDITFKVSYIIIILLLIY